MRRSFRKLNPFVVLYFETTEAAPICALTCLMAVTVMTKKRGRPLVTGEVGVSIINWKNKFRGVSEAEPPTVRVEQPHNRGDSRRVTIGAYSYRC